MKKIVSLGLAAALASGMVFAAEPAANPSVLSFTGEASVEWGVDLDAGKTGFKNTEKAGFKVKLFDGGDKVTEKNGDIWAELKIKVDTEEDEAKNTDAAEAPLKIKRPSVEEAKFHLYNFFIGIRSGDTQTGAYKFDGAIRSADNDNAKWLSDVGPAGYSEGIVAGYDDANLNVAVDFRSKKDASTNYTDNYAIAAEAKLKDSNELVKGLFVDVGGSVNLSEFAWKKGANSETVKELFTMGTAPMVVENVRTIGYSANAGYKLSIDDKLFVKPAVGFTGTFKTGTAEIANKTATGTSNENALVVGALFGWGANADANAGVYYLDGDMAKKVTPGVSVVAAIPLPSTTSASYDGKTATTTTIKALQALIVPSFYLGDVVPGLKAACYSEIGILDYVEAKDQVKKEGDNTTTRGSAAVKGDTFAFALAAGVAYDIKADAVTITPKAGMRFVNACYVDNNIKSIAPLSTNKVFDNLGVQKNATEGDRAGKTDAAGYMNLKLGCDVAGLINNTTFFVVYESANLLNNTDYTAAPYNKDLKYYNVKAGTLNVGAKISF